MVRILPYPLEEQIGLVSMPNRQAADKDMPVLVGLWLIVEASGVPSFEDEPWFSLSHGCRSLTTGTADRLFSSAFVPATTMQIKPLLAAHRSLWTPISAPTVQ